jgi:hypothetical protein
MKKISLIFLLLSLNAYAVLTPNIPFGGPGSAITYEPDDSGDWPGTVPNDASEALDLLAARPIGGAVDSVNGETGVVSLTSIEIPYAPTTPADWTEGAPAEIGDALDKLAARVSGGGGSGWYLDVNIGGANISPATSAQTAYVTLVNSGLDLVVNTGSVSAEIPCAAGTASTGLTCTAADESVGVVFTPGSACAIKVCAEFSHYYECNTGSGGCGSAIVYQIIETTNTSTAITAEGKSRLEFFVRDVMDATVNVQHLFPFHVCGVFAAGASERTFRLGYEKTINSNLNTNSILADRSANEGQRDMHWTSSCIN